VDGDGPRGFALFQHMESNAEGSFLEADPWRELLGFERSAREPE